MKKFLITCLTGLAGLFWVIGLGMAFRTDSGHLYLACVGAALAIKFGPSLVQGRFRQELRDSVPNAWTRRYLVFFAYCLFAFPGIMTSLGQWSVPSPQSTPYGSSNDWTIALMVALLLPAMMLLIWSHATSNGREKPAEVK